MARIDEWLERYERRQDMLPRPSKDTREAAEILEEARHELALTRLRIARLCVNGSPSRGLAEGRDALRVLKYHLRHLKGESERTVPADALIDALEDIYREMLDHRKML